MQKKLRKIGIIITNIFLIFCLFYLTKYVFAEIAIPTLLGIKKPYAELIFNPPYSTGFYTSGNVYAQVIGTGIRENLFIITENNTYTFYYYRGTGPFSTGEGFSPTNTRSKLSITGKVDWIDKIAPVISGFTSGTFYKTDKILSFSDNIGIDKAILSGIDGNDFYSGNIQSGTLISGEGKYMLTVYDIAGNTTSIIFGIDKILPTAIVEYYPNSGNLTSGNVIAKLTGFSEKDIIILNNGGSDTFIFGANTNFTFLFQDQAGNTGATQAQVTRIDKIPPQYYGIQDGGFYTTDVTITFADNFPGVSATLNNQPFLSGTTIKENGTYLLKVFDIVGHIVTATFTINKGGNNGGGGSIGNLSSGTTGKEEKEFIPPLQALPPQAKINAEDIKKYSEEMLEAYKYAYALGITTKSTVSEANLDGPLIRKELAKMISEFAIKIVGLKPDNNKKCEFPDINKESEEMKYYIRLSCKLGLMGLKADGIQKRETFMPNEYVNRAQFGTVFSRLIFGLEYNLKEDEMTLFDQVVNKLKKTTQSIAELFGIRYAANIQIDRYTKHLNALKNNNIMNNINPLMQELRGYAMIMMMRADKNGTIQKNHTNTKFQINSKK